MIFKNIKMFIVFLMAEKGVRLYTKFKFDR